MPPAEQNVKRQHPEAVLRTSKISTPLGHKQKYYIVDAKWAYKCYSDTYDSPAEAWAEAEKNLTKEKEK